MAQRCGSVGLRAFAMTLPVGTDAQHLGGSLDDLLADARRQLEVLPAASASCDPLAFARAQQEEEARVRQAATRSRAEAMDQTLAAANSEEALWRKQVRERKEAERRRQKAALAEEATRAAEAISVDARTDGAASPLAAARSMWKADDRARDEARAAVAADQSRAEDQWLEQEWAPLLARKREELRISRARTERREQEEQVAAATDRQRENEAMACEDAAATTFMSAVAAECHSRAHVVPDIATMDCMKRILARAQQERCQAAVMEAQRCQAEEEERRRDEERRDHEYRAWKAQVSAERVRRQRLEQLKALQQPAEPAERGGVDVDQRARVRGQDFAMYIGAERGGSNDLLGSDASAVAQQMGNVVYAQMQQKVAHRNCIRSAELQSQCLWEKGIEPRRLLSEALELAEQRKKRAEEMEPAQAEQALWEALLTKNRIKQRKERLADRPQHWGFNMRAEAKDEVQA